MTSPIKAVKVEDKKTKEIKTAIYATNRLGNKQYNVDGKFLNDRSFGKLFKIVTD